MPCAFPSAYALGYPMAARCAAQVHPLSTLWSTYGMIPRHHSPSLRKRCFVARWHVLPSTSVLRTATPDLWPAPL